MRGSSDLMYLLTRAERLLARRLADILDAERCTTDAWRVVSALADGKGHFMTELSDLASLPPGSLTRLVDQLVEENLVYRRGDDVDRRRIRVHLAARGRRLHERVSQQISARVGELAPDERLAPLLEELIEACSPRHTFAARK
ncbi:MarR family transcriptional regulator [Actinoplanes missouriensis]|uniref:MarR family winged helix-turn-helix transcriptional regulator n=1 Tax=Actinoplanes missouriensis TaxID=1866 RepID=UPI0033DF1FAC